MTDSSQEQGVEPTQEPIPAAADAVTEAAPAVDLAARVAELEGLLRDQQLRSQAEIQNIQRRAERDVTHAHKFALEKFAGSLLEVVDNLERALGSVPSEAVSYTHLRAHET